MGKHFELVARTPFRDQPRILGTRGGPARGKESGDFNRDFYLKRKYLDTFTEEELATINKTVDKLLLAKLGYELMERVDVVVS